MRKSVTNVDGSQIGACVTLALVFISVSCLFAQSYVFTFLKTCTTNTDSFSANLTDANTTDVDVLPPVNVAAYSWHTFAFGFGVIIGAIATLFTQNLNSFHILALFGCLSGILTVLMGVFDGFVPLLVLRLFHGICLSLVFTAAVIICKTQKPFLIHTFLSIFHVPLGLIILSPIIGSFSSNWSITNYILGALTIVFFILATISSIVTRQNNHGMAKRTSTLTFRVFINDTKRVSVFGSIFGTLFASQFIIQFAHIYFDNTHGLTLSTIGWVTPIPYILAVWIMALIYYATKYKPRPLSAMISLFLCILLVLLALLPQDEAWLSMAVFLIIFVASSVSIGCCFQMIPIPSPQHLFYTAITVCLLNGLSTLLLSVIVAAATFEDTETHWQTVFIVISVIMIVCLSLANVIRQCNIRKWAEFNVTTQKPEATAESATDKSRPKQGVIVSLERAVSACKVVSDRIHVLSIKSADSPDYSGTKTVAFIHDRERVTAV